jgi:hypothetical protein
MTPSPLHKQQAACISGQGAIDKFLKPIQTVVNISDDDANIMPNDGCAVPAIPPLTRRRFINDDDDDEVSAQPQHKEQPSNINLAVTLQPQSGSQGPHESQKSQAITMTVTASKRRTRHRSARKPSYRTIPKRTPKDQVSSRNG